MKKKIILILIAAVLTFAFVAAVGSLASDIAGFGKRRFESSCEMTVQHGYSPTSSNGTVLTDLYAAFNGTDLSEHEQNVLVLKELGIANEIIERMSAEDVDQILSNAKSVQVKVQYFKTDKNGKYTQVEADEWTDLVDRYRNGSHDGACIRMTLMSVYSTDDSSEVAFHAWYENAALDGQSYEYTISMEASDFAWSDHLQPDYSLGYCYTVKASDGVEKTYLERMDGNSCEFIEKGIAGSGEVSVDGEGSSVTYFQCYLSGKGWVSSPTEANTFPLTVKCQSAWKR